jgi:hypothetical protein
MTDVATMLNAYPGKLPWIDENVLIVCIQRTLNSAQVCTACADSCIADPSAAHLGRCVGAALNCGDHAMTTMRVLSRPTAYDAALTRATLQAFVEASRMCYDECRKHALEHEHCRVCADVCRDAGQDCRHLLTLIA